MKIFWPLIFTLLAVPGFIRAQGRVDFSSAQSGVNARFYLPADSPYGNVALTASHPYHADLFWRPGTTTVGVSAAELTNRCFFNQSFSSVTASAGYFTGGSKTVSGWVSGPIVAQVRVWHSSIADFNQYPFWPGTCIAFSPLFVLTPTTSPTAPARLVGLGNPATYTLFTITPPQTNPIISFNNQTQRLKAGTTASFTGSAYSTFPLTYQWLFNGAPLNSATNPSLTITNVGPANIGSYYFVAANSYDSATSSPAVLQAYTLLSISNGPMIQLQGAVGYPFRLDYRESLRAESNWLELATITLTNTAQWYLDGAFDGLTPRYYRGMQLP